jgi:hypothetical protein
MAADGDALLAEHGSDTGLGDAVASGNLLCCASGLVSPHNVGEVIDGQEALRARWWAVMAAAFASGVLKLRRQVGVLRLGDRDAPVAGNELILTHAGSITS